MSGRYHSYLNTAQSLISDFPGDQPFHLYLRSYFRNHPKHGSRDRRQISGLCYSYFRTGRALAGNNSTEPSGEMVRHAAGSNLPLGNLAEKILAAHFLCADAPDELLNFFHPEWAGAVTGTPDQKIAFLSGQGVELDIENLFPLADRLSGMLDDKRGFILSHLVQPRLFLRIRPGREEQVEEALTRSGILFNKLDHCVELAIGTDLEKALEVDRDAVVQDLSSQSTGRYIAAVLDELGNGATVWDSCAASGGKSLLAFDHDNTIKLTVSDIRNNILQSLSQRFHRAGISNYRSFIKDLTAGTVNEKFGLVIVDAPCSGSGTWGRTPEALSSFNSPMLNRYCTMQGAIAVNAAASVAAGGHLLYFTCSVYEDENEKAVQHVLDNTGLNLRKMELVQGWQRRADSMFMAWFSA